MFIDARVPVLFGTVEDAGPDDALLIDGDMEAPAGRVVARLSGDGATAHVAGCVCCVPRSAAGSALAGLFLARGRGDVAFFRRVVAVTQDREAIFDAVANDMLASGWFRWG
jgi:hypothetical protein